MSGYVYIVCDGCGTEFARAFGDPAAARERLRYTEERRCTCGSPHPEKWGTRWKHKPPCPRAGRKF